MFARNLGVRILFCIFAVFTIFSFASFALRPNNIEVEVLESSTKVYAPADPDGAAEKVVIPDELVPENTFHGDFSHAELRDYRVDTVAYSFLPRWYDADLLPLGTSLRSSEWKCSAKFVYTSPRTDILNYAVMLDHGFGANLDTDESNVSLSSDRTDTEDVSRVTHASEDLDTVFVVENDEFALIESDEAVVSTMDEPVTSEFPYTQDEIDMLATVVYNEAWGGCTTRHRELVAAVVMNRVKSDIFPDTVYEVVCQPNQYSTAYADPYSDAGQNARSSEENWRVCQEIAIKAMNGEVDCPDNVLFQANFVQGHGIYETCYTSYSVSYFCYY